MSSHFRGDKLGEGGQIGERVTNRMGGTNGVGRINMGLGQAGGGDKQVGGISVSKVNRYVGEARKRPAGARIWARRALKL